METQTSLPVVPLAALIETYKACPRMTHRKWVQWAVLCAKRALPRFTEVRPDEARPGQAIAAAEAWLADPTETTARAARAASYAAAHAAAHAASYAAYAAYAAAHAAHAAAHATYAADAAHAAAHATYAADAAARATDVDAYATEQQWQALRLMDIYHTED